MKIVHENNEQFLLTTARKKDNLFSVPYITTITTKICTVLNLFYCLETLYVSWLDFTASRK